jgi:hypothetical protein
MERPVSTVSLAESPNARERFVNLFLSLFDGGGPVIYMNRSRR